VLHRLGKTADAAPTPRGLPFTVRSIDFACHTAHLDDANGCGLLVRPLPPHDVPDPLRVGSLHEADWTAAMRFLHSIGWEPSEGDDGGLVHEGYTVDGREVVGLFGWDPVTSLPTIPQQASSFEELRSVAGLR
jgi:hypothetical protein